jgi:hypothetical protein
MSRKVSDNPQDWNEEDVLYLHQYDQRAEEVKARAEELGVTLPEPTGVNAPQRAGVPEPGLPCPTCGQMVPESAAPGSDQEASVAGEYDDLTKEELRTEIAARSLDDPPSSATKAELVQTLIDDDEG